MGEMGAVGENKYLFPHGGEKWLLTPRFPRRPVELIQEYESCIFTPLDPRLLAEPTHPRVGRRGTPTTPPFLVFAKAVRVGNEENAARSERSGQAAECLWEGGGGHVEEAGVAEDPVETTLRKIQRSQVLLPHLAPRVQPRNVAKLLDAVNADGAVSHLGEGEEIAAAGAAHVEDVQWRRSARERRQECLNVLAHVMVEARSSVTGGARGVVGDGGARGLAGLLAR